MKHSLVYKDRYTLSYAEYGDPHGYPILIQHGLIASIQDSALFESLARLGTRLICIARPGYGESSPYLMNDIGEWGEIAAVLVDHLALAEFDVLGMSSGAPYSYAIGHRMPGQARNIFIFSGIPALYDEQIASHWPWEVKKDASIAEMQALAYDLFFAHLSPEARESSDVRDSMRNGGFGLAQDFRLRGMDWGFRLQDLKTRVWMRHSRADDAVPFITAEMTAGLLPNCQLDIRENEAHFSQALLDDFIRTTMADHYSR